MDLWKIGEWQNTILFGTFVFRSWHTAILFGAFVFFCFEDFCFLSRAERHVIRQTYFACLADFCFSFMAYRHAIRRICFILLRGLLFSEQGRTPCYSANLFCLSCRLLFFVYSISLRHSAHLFYFASRIYFNSCTPPADRLLFLHIKCFLLSQVSCCSCTSGAPRLPSCKRLRSKECSRCRMKMALCHCRGTKDCEANNIQCAEWKWRYATAEQQQTAKQTTSNAQNKMVFCPTRTTRDSSNVQL